MPLPPDSLRLFGVFQLMRQGEPITFGQTRLEQLIAFRINEVKGNHRPDHCGEVEV